MTSYRSEEFGETLVSEYPPGAAIGWHRDAPPFGVIVGFSLLASCTMKFRSWPLPSMRRGSRGERLKPPTQTLDRRSLYVIDGKARTSWQHHIPPIKALRYSITFRTLRAG